MIEVEETPVRPDIWLDEPWWVASGSGNRVAEGGPDGAERGQDRDSHQRDQQATGDLHDDAAKDST